MASEVTWVRGPVKRAGVDGPDANGWVIEGGYFGVHYDAKFAALNERNYVITHLPTGLAAWRAKTRKEAQYIAEKLNAIPGIEKLTEARSKRKAWTTDPIRIAIREAIHGA